jgi:hypothetical protein
MSTSSSIVSFRGDDEADFEESCDELFRETQNSINSIHMTIRTLAMSEDRCDTYEEKLKIHHEIVDYIETVNSSFIELSKLSFQIVGKPRTDEEKLHYKKVIEERKQAKQRLKEQEKLEKEQAKLAKQTSNLKI